VRRLSITREAERRLRSGHLWIYANEFGVKLGSLGIAPGERVEILTPSGRSLGVAGMNPNVLIAARLYSAAAADFAAHDWLTRRIHAACALRRRLGVHEAGRLVFGESDGLPGLVVDRYGPVLSVQVGTAAMEALREPIADVLLALDGVETLVWRDDIASRALEGLPGGIALSGAEPGDPVWIEENGGRFGISPVLGQKTGWYYDQRDNRALLLPLVRGARVLDLCSYAGGWGVCAAVHGARSALCVDVSETALAAVARNAGASTVGDRVGVLRADAFEACRSLREAGERFEVVVVDPPAFVKRRKDLEEGSLAYRRLNEAALKLVAPGGLLVSCSCSHHFDEAALQQALARAALASGRNLRILRRLGQSADHPVHPAMPETFYLKGFLCAVD
jgi:23S rRNA (cytosine1962-C5)-methyltransferase